jgi:hypothetical protein
MRNHFALNEEVAPLRLAGSHIGALSEPVAEDQESLA